MKFARQYWGKLLQDFVNDPPTRVVICTYGFYTALQNWPYHQPPPYHKLTQLQSLLYHLNEIDSTIVITPGQSPIEPEVEVTKRAFPNICFQKHERNHAKIVLFNKGKKFRIWTGSCNFTTSNTDGYYDSLAEVLAKDDLKNHLKLLTAITREASYL